MLEDIFINMFYKWLSYAFLLDNTPPLDITLLLCYTEPVKAVIL